MRKNKKKIKIGNPTYAPFLLLAVLGTSFFMNHQLESRIESIKDEQQTLTVELQSMENDLNQISTIISRIETVKGEFIQKEEARPIGTPWDKVLDEISGSTPSDVTITSIQEGTEMGVIKLEAKTIKMKNMAETKESFDKNPHFTNTKIANFTANTSVLERPQTVTFTLMTTYKGENPQSTGLSSTGEMTPDATSVQDGTMSQGVPSSETAPTTGAEGSEVQ